MTITAILRWLTLTSITILAFVVPPAVQAADTDIPQPMPLVTTGDETLTFMLFGTATDNPNNPGLADMVMLVTIDRAAGSAAMLSVPRDLWVYAPALDRMMKLTAVYFEGEMHRLEGGGVGLLKETLRYNLGIEVDYYAHVNFTGFLNIIDTLGGVDVAVDCIIRDWKLKERHLDKRVAEHYAIFTIPIGLHRMDADTALWYVRSRRTSTDLDRGRRQQDVLRAMWRRIRAGDQLTRLPTLWDQVTRVVDTDLTLPDVAGLVPFALGLEPERIAPFRFRMGTHIRNALSPAPERAAILAPDREAVIDLMQQFVTPPTANQVSQAALRVAIVNASGFESLVYVAADRLAQEGFVPVLVNEPTRYRNYTAIYDYTGQTKGSPVPALQRVLRVTDEGVIVQPDPDRAYDYKIFLGNSYAYWSCTRDVIQPTPEQLAADEARAAGETEDK